MMTGAPADESFSPLDEAFLRRQAAGDPALVQEVAALFREQLHGQMAVIVGNGVAARRYEAAHTLKGASLAIGARPLADAARAVETVLRRAAENGGGAVDLPAALVEPLEAAAAACDAALAALIARG